MNANTTNMNKQTNLFESVMQVLRVQIIHIYEYTIYSPGAYVVPVNMNVNFWQHA